MFRNSPYSLDPFHKPYNHTLQNDLQHQLCIMQAKHSTQLSQLKYQLSNAISTNQQLQYTLQQEKIQSFELRQIKRRLQEQIQRLQFQINQKITSEHLTQREKSIKSQNILFENQRINKQLNQIAEQLSRTRQQCRKLQTENNKILLENQQLKLKNKQLMEKHQVQKDISWQVQANKQFNNTIQQFNKTSKQYRILLNQYNNLKAQYSKINQKNLALKQYQAKGKFKPQVHFGQNMINNIPSIQNYKTQLKAEESEKSQKKRSNKSLKQTSLKKSKLKQIHNQKSAKQDLWKGLIEPNIIKILNSTNKKSQNFLDQSLKTSRLSQNRQQKVFEQITNLRKQLISQILNKYYNKSVNIAKKMKSNCLKQFIKLINKDIKTLKKMAFNYIQAKNSVESQIGKPIIQLKITDDWAGKVYAKVKEQDTKQSSGKQLAVFRYLTIQTKLQNSHPMVPVIQNQLIECLRSIKLEKSTK